MQRLASKRCGTLESPTLHVPGEQCVGRVGEQRAEGKKGQIITDLVYHVFCLGFNSAPFNSETQNNKV